MFSRDRGKRKQAPVRFTVLMAECVFAFVDILLISSQTKMILQEKINVNKNLSLFSKYFYLCACIKAATTRSAHSLSEAEREIISLISAAEIPLI